jgi:hypothetical protein
MSTRIGAGETLKGGKRDESKKKGRGNLSGKEMVKSMQGGSIYNEH